MVRSMPERIVTPVRLSEAELQEAEEKREAYDLPDLSKLIRFAIKRLRKPTK